MNADPERCRCPAIQADDLHLSYGPKRVLAAVSLAIPECEITALIGPSGCGKTSFLSCLNRMTDLIPSCRVTGRLQMGPLDVLRPEVDVVQLRRRVGMIFQKPNPFALSIRKNLALPLREHGVRRRDDVDRVIETVLRDVGLWDEVKDRLHHPALALSGGQQQRLCLARALALEPEVILLDEPCSALDPIAAGVVEEHIRSLRGRYTVVIVTHNLAQARRLADRVALFWLTNGTGEIVESGPVDDVFEHPRHSVTEAYVQGRRG